MSTTRSPSRPGPAAIARRKKRTRRLLVQVAATGAVALGLLYFLALRGGGGQGGAGGGSGPPFAVGKPGPGQQAPMVRLESTTGDTFDLAAQRGKSVLLYFQEGVGCQPCWTQMLDIDRNWSQFQALGVDSFVTVTGDPVDRLKEKVADEGIKTPVLSDPDLSLGQTFNANQYGMMGTSTYGHTFVLVGPDGRIQWRADYGGAPKYTMYVKLPDLLDDLRAGLGRTS